MCGSGRSSFHACVQESVLKDNRGVALKKKKNNSEDTWEAVRMEHGLDRSIY